MSRNNSQPTESDNVLGDVEWEVFSSDVLQTSGKGDGGGHDHGDRLQERRETVSVGTLGPEIHLGQLPPHAVVS